MKENCFYKIFKEEQLPQKSISPGIWKTEDSFNAALKLFEFIPCDEDERWQIIANYANLPKETLREPLHFENAMRAIYLSYNLSFKNGIPSNSTDPNIRQICRAVNNLSYYPTIKSFFNQNQLLNNRTKIEFSLTDRIQMGTNKRNITGCPEAVYQLRLIYNEKYIGRIGFNIHTEDQKIISITNIQGIPEGIEIYNQFNTEFGSKPFNFLINQLKKFSETENAKIRGLKNPKHNGSLYNSIFKKEQIPVLSFNKVKLSENL